MRRRDYLATVAATTTGALAGCGGGDDGGGESTPSGPSFAAEFDLPDGVTITDTWDLALKIANTSETDGTFDSPLSLRESQEGDWEEFDTLQLDLDAKTQTTWTREAITWDTETTLGFRVDALDVVANLDVTVPEAYNPSYARENASQPDGADIFRQLSEYTGKPVTFRRAEVIDYSYSSDAPDEYLFNVTNKVGATDYQARIYTYARTSKRLVLGDVAQVWVVPERYTEEGEGGLDGPVPYCALIDYDLKN